MTEQKWARWGAASGFAALVAGAAGGALERGWPSGNDPGAVASFIAGHRAAILGQSMLFMLSSAFYLWFLGCLRTFLARAEGSTGRLSGVAFGAGTVWVAISMMAQAFQVGQTMAAPTGVQPVMMWTMAATFAIATLPCAVMLAAVATVSFRHAAFPRWLGGISVAAAVAQLLLWSGAVVTSGPLAPNGWLTYVLYPLFLLWLVPTTAVMIKRSGAEGTET
ncbi:MAG TPA: hypothetical protein VGQ83_02875 [Polyangia bacterium]|jgi:hypothetical protein